MDTSVSDKLEPRGIFSARCLSPANEHDRRAMIAWAEMTKADMTDDVWLRAADALGIKLIQTWTDEFRNTVCTIGKNVALDAFLAGSSYTVTGPFMGLISSTSYSAISAADTMTSHAGWLEAGNANAPTYTAPRKTCAWNAASGGSKSLSAALSFAMTGSGTAKGGFLTFGSGAVSTIDNTSGTLLSAGLFSGGDRPVLSGDTIQVSYSMSM